MWLTYETPSLPIVQAFVLYRVFNYVLKLLYLGCQWKELPIEKNEEGRPEIHYTRIYGAFRRYEDHGCFDQLVARIKT